MTPRSRIRRRSGAGIRLVYVSPLKALSYDVERNLRAPLKGIGAPISVGLRTGDTPQRDRQAMLRKPPDILITTPESLYLMMSSRAKEILTGVEAVIVDEIHAVAQTKRGAHMALTLERLEHLVRNHEEGRGPDATVQRIGLSATQRPLERIAKFLVGPQRECEIVNAGIRKQLDLEIIVPVDDMTDPARRPHPRRCGRIADATARITATASRSIPAWRSTPTSIPTPTRDRSGRRSTPSCSTSSSSTRRRSSSSTTAAGPSGWRSD